MQASRNIREQQDAAYQASLRADQEKAEKARQEQELLMKQKELEEKEKERIERDKQEKIQRREYLKENLVPEPVDGKIAKMSIRLPNGDRYIRKFDANAPLQQLYDFVESNDLQPIDILAEIVVVNTYPRREYRDKTISFEDAGLYPNASVIVEELIESDVDE